MWAGVVCAASGLAAAPAAAEALLVIEADSGKVIFAHNAGQPWYPASTTKLMTAYVTLRAVKEGRITLDRPIVVSANAAAQSPVKMGFPPGTVITVDNALKMLMVKSANDMAVVLAEGVAGSVENFADEMNNNARRLGMVQSSFVNPNGLPAEPFDERVRLRIRLELRRRRAHALPGAAIRQRRLPGGTPGDSISSLQAKLTLLSDRFRSWSAPRMPLALMIAAQTSATDLLSIGRGLCFVI
jgi:hypothetical protein